MYPHVWESGERPSRRKTFADFQAIPLDVLEEASVSVLGIDPDILYQKLLPLSKPANDNDSLSNIALIIFVDKDMMAMLQCWVSCNKDMLLAKLTYEQGMNYGTQD